MKLQSKFSITHLLLLSFILAASCKKNHDFAPEAKQDGFAFGSFKEANIDSMSILNLENEITRGSHNIHSILILKNDKLIHEKYFTGDDAVFPVPVGVVAHARDSLHDCRSITKSIVSACVGIAIQQDKIHSIDDKVFNYFPSYAAYATGAKANITIRNLLTMSAGLEWDENAPPIDTLNSEINMAVKPDVIDFVISRSLVQQPGGLWNYSGGCTQLLAEIVKKTTGMAIDEFADKYLFKPLNISNYNWFIRGPLIPGSPETVWAPSGLRLRPVDMAKIGSLYLNNGRFDGKQILPDSWVEQSLHWQINTDTTDEGYGFQFWCYKPMIAGQLRDVIQADGNGGQRICMIPSLGVNIILTAGNYNETGSIADSLLTTVFFPALH